LFSGKAGRSGAVLDAEFWINAFEMLADGSGFDPEDCCDLAVRLAAREPSKYLIFPGSQGMMTTRRFLAGTRNDLKQ